MPGASARDQSQIRVPRSVAGKLAEPRFDVRQRRQRPIALKQQPPAVAVRLERQRVRHVLHS